MNIYPPITLIAITGGPGAGKTEAINRVSQALSSEGVYVGVVQEAATHLINNEGWKPWALDSTGQAAFQIRHVGLQYAWEGEQMFRAIPKRQPVVVLCDRGLMDGAAYHGLDGWDLVLAAHGLSMARVAARYDAVIHLETSAALDPEQYPGRRNPARWQNPAEAVDSDRELQKVWSFHPRHIVIPAQADFTAKVEQLRLEVAGVMAEQSGSETRTGAFASFAVR